MSTLPRNYDAWRLASPFSDDLDALGVEDGDICNRFPEPDEDTPRNWRSRPCGGLMVTDAHGDVVCENCGAVA
jgi:hypothetical protein